MREEENEMRSKVDSMNNQAVKTHVSVPGLGGATFKDVVSDFARHHDLTFYPKLGPKSTKDGKHIYILGDTQIYLDANIVFALRGTVWQPTSLDDDLRIDATYAIFLLTTLAQYFHFSMTHPSFVGNCLHSSGPQFV